MERRTIGRDGVSVSALGLGTFTWGDRTDRDEAAKQVALYLEAGGNLFDTADIYGAGAAEEWLGEVLGATVRREDVVIATKAAGVVTEAGPQPPNASREHILAALDASLRRLRTDYVDLWQMHMWDMTTPIEETMAAIDTALSSGRVRQVGVCNYDGPQVRQAAQWLAEHGSSPLGSVQVEYSLVQRAPELTVLPAVADLGLGLLPWAPLGRGVLTGKYRAGLTVRRAENPFLQAYVSRHLNARSAELVEVLAGVADDLGSSPLAVSLAWVRDRPGVTAPLVGARTAEQLKDSLAEQATSLALPADVVELLDKASAPAQ